MLDQGVVVELASVLVARLIQTRLPVDRRPCKREHITKESISQCTSLHFCQPRCWYSHWLPGISIASVKARFVIARFIPFATHDIVDVLEKTTLFSKTIYSFHSHIRLLGSIACQHRDSLQRWRIRSESKDHNEQGNPTSSNAEL